MSQLTLLDCFGNTKSGMTYGIRVSFSDCWVVNGKSIGTRIKRLRHTGYGFEKFIMISIILFSFVNIYIGWEGSIK